MNKIPSLFVRNYGLDGDPNKNHFHYRNEVTPGCEWVLAGEGAATRKWDGSACLWRDCRLFKRYDLKAGKPTPSGFVPCVGADGHIPGWVPIGDGPEDKWHHEALASVFAPVDGATYELVGPKINGNRDGFEGHILVRHGALVVDNVPREFTALGAWLGAHPIEGVVFHHPDGRMAKATRQCFGHFWGAKR
jgi:hypothetical protein